MTLLDFELDTPDSAVEPFKTQLLKWVGNKQRFAHEIASYFPPLRGQTYFEPFLGSAAVLATLRPEHAVGSDAFGPLIGIWRALRSEPETLIDWYASRWHVYRAADDPRDVYEAVKASYNEKPNAADLLFLSRTCYGGVVRFRATDGYMSTPMGVHMPISPDSFRERVGLWRERTAGADFRCVDYRAIFAEANAGDVIYCDPPYTHTQTILYGAQSFSLTDLFSEIAAAKDRGVHVALSIDGSKESGRTLLKLPIPEGLFEREVFVNVGRSMLKRFQMQGQSLHEHVVADRLLLTY